MSSIPLTHLRFDHHCFTIHTPLKYILHIILKFQKILYITILYYLHDYIRTTFQTQIASFITRTLNYNNAPFHSTYTAALYAYTAIINRNCVGVPEIERKLDVLASGIFHFLRGFNIHFFLFADQCTTIYQRARLYIIVGTY